MPKPKTFIRVVKRGDKYDANVYGYSHGITGADSEAEAVGRVVMLLSYPLGISIETEEEKEKENQK